MSEIEKQLMPIVEAGDADDVCMLLCVNAVEAKIANQRIIDYVQKHSRQQTDHYSGWVRRDCRLCPATFEAWEGETHYVPTGPACAALTEIAKVLLT